MKSRSFKKWGFIMAALLIAMACTDDLNLVPPGEFSGANVLQSKEGLESVLFSAYNFNRTVEKNTINMNEVSTDMGFNTGGGENRTLSLFVNFSWDPSTAWINNNFWLPKYRAIRDANVVINNIESAGNIEENDKRLFVAEARFIRASAYAWLHNYFGAVPLRTTGNLEEEEANLPKADEAELLSFIETELNAAVADLPNPGEESQYGRATKGHTLGVLTKFLLQTKQWAKVEQASQQLINLNYYELHPTFRELFFIENEGNKEMVIVQQQLNVNGSQNNYQNGAFPPGFRRSPNIPEFEWTSSMANWATQYRLQDNFIDSFDPADTRLQAIIQEYYNANGDLVNLRDQVDNSRCLKYFDNNQTGNACGADQPVIRYSDILLSRAEALNELNGPTQEGLDLINTVRNRANLGDLILGDVASKEALRDLILMERGWEFVSEGKRRDDLVRHDKFVSSGIERGYNAQPHHVRWPIPEAEINANPNIEQNDGY